MGEAFRIILILFGTLPGAFTGFLTEGLKKEFATAVLVGGTLSVPDQAFVPNRQQYQAEAFLPCLAPWCQGTRDLVLGITAIDLFVPQLNFVFGLADPRHRRAVISLARLDPRFYGRPADPELWQARALKEAVHELGHLMGLPHCQDPRCIMFFSNTLADTDRKGPGFCPQCRGRLQQ